MLLSRRACNAGPGHSALVHVIITEPQKPPTRRPVAAWARRLLLAAWIVVIALAPLTGEREGRFSHLRNELAQGRVTELTVRGDGLGEGAVSGTANQTVVWEGRWGITRHDQVRVVVRDPADEFVPDRSGPEVETRDLATYLSQTYPGVSVERHPRDHRDDRLFGFGHLPGALYSAYLLVLLGSVVVLLAGPEPWRATRPGWFWAGFFVPWVAVPLFLLLSGPTPFVPAPGNERRRLTGPAAFLLGLFVPGIVAATWQARIW
ncbi:hypothetical protein [Kineosporia succinea]|uniref:Membrane protein DUF2207 n=1 Tax=Kineosporia succinea TaxID=84632 RepID=A0ABT9NXA5_9ACTN|nr:hypothetical protein [Kineosporia succinea]MDP9825058.1 hypothetical protein [Kineosporia succinea]